MSRPPPPIELLVSDVDGTLVHPDKTVGMPTVDAVRRLRDAGVLFTIVSSRPPRGMLYPIYTSWASASRPPPSTAAQSSTRTAASRRQAACR